MNDDELMAEVRGVLAATDAVPPRVLHDAEQAFGVLRLDDELDELAELVFDSIDDPAPVGVRGPLESRRQLTFRADDLVIECEVSPDGLLGQVLGGAARNGSGATSLELRAGRGGGPRLLPVDPEGWFTAEPPPSGPVSFRWRREGRPDLVTPWLLL